MTKPYSPRLPADPKADPRPTQESLDVAATTSDLTTESSAIRDRTASLGRCACVAYLHASLDAGAPTTLAAAGARITTVGTTVAVVLNPPVDTPYSVRVDDQGSASDLVYRADSRLSGSLTIRATDMAGAAVDMSVGDRSFVLMLTQLLPGSF